MTSFITKDFKLNQRNAAYLKKFKTPFGFNGIGEFVYYRTYSRCFDGKQETFDDTVLRVINGVFSIFKSYIVDKDTLSPEDQIKYAKYYTEEWQQKYARRFGSFIRQFKCTPPGRGLWSMGTDLIKERGAAPLYNCASCSTIKLSESMEWAMLMLMNGVGVGFVTDWQGTARAPATTFYYQIPDTREGWAKSVGLLLDAYTADKAKPIFDYSLIRPEGAPIVHFGGIASGPAPLKLLHIRIVEYMETFITTHNHTRTVADIANAIGCCVVSGNVRRSAEILISPASGPGSDLPTFLNLKNMEVNPERESIAYTSNNSIGIYKEEDYKIVDAMVERVITNGEPGLINFVNVQKYGRLGEESPDKATGANPCGEIPLESYETCNLSDVNLPHCDDEEEIYEAMEFAAFYCCCVSALPTHSKLTNDIIAMNHRIGVSPSGVVEAIAKYGHEQMKIIFNRGYKKVRETADLYGKLLGFAKPCIRITTVKPSGTTSLLAGVAPGAHYPTFNYCRRRIRVGKLHPVAKILIDAGIKYEQCVYADSSWCFEFYYKKDNVRSATEVSIEEQFKILKLIQEFWADNMVSITIYFNEEEKARLGAVVKEYLPHIKSVSLLPHTEAGVYDQPPYEGICRMEYLRSVYGEISEAISDNEISEEDYIKTVKGEFDPVVHMYGGYSSCKFDWQALTGSQGEDEKYCTGVNCVT